MRILHLLASPAWTGPMENVALLADAQRALGHQVTVAIDRKRRTASSEEVAAPRLAELGLLDEGGLELSVKSTPLGWLRDARSLRRREVDVVHSHFSHDHLLARFFRPDRAVVVRSIHAERSLRRKLPIADAYTVAAPAWLGAFVGQLARVLPPLIAKEFRPAEDRSGLRERLGLRGAPLFGMISTFQPSRRHAVALSAFARIRERLPEAQLLLVGDGVLGPALRAQVSRLGIDSAVTFAGYQSGEAFVRHLQALDEVWLLGLGNDFSARAAVQARACGVRVVAVDEGALARYADELIPPEPEPLAAVAGGEERISVPLPSNRQTAEEILELYRRAGAPK